MVDRVTLLFTFVVCAAVISWTSAAPRIVSQTLILNQQFECKGGDETTSKSDLLTDLKSMINAIDSGKTSLDQQEKQHDDKCIDNKQPAICEDVSFDAATRASDDSIYFFKGPYYWKLELYGSMDSRPKNISNDWRGLPGNLDAAITLVDGYTVFFKGHQCWRFLNKKLVSGYPKLINQEFPGIPDNLNAAVIWGYNNKQYFFKDSNYWRFDKEENPPVNKDYPLPIGKWTGIPDNVDAAMLGHDRQTYFFKGNYYYKYNDTSSRLATDKRYPRLISEWGIFECKPE